MTLANWSVAAILFICTFAVSSALSISGRCLGSSCALPLCAGNSRPVVPEGECCPKCQPDCSAVLCLRPECEPGQILVTPEGECCPECRLDCALVDCALPICTTGERAIVPEGECCPICVPDPTCAAVSCVIPVCLAGQVPRVPEGECCPICTCEIEGQTFSECASACPRTCELQDIVCRAQCRPGCQCPEGQVVDTMNGRCVPPEECPEPCPVRGQVRSPCAGCDTTCNQFINGEIIFCPAVCRVGGCSCPGGQLIDTMNNECSTPDECPNPCEIKKCLAGSRCKIFEPTGEAFCEPSCSIDNGGCSSCQSCSLQEVQCVRAPCPPVVQCTDICSLPAETGPCRAAIPRYFHNNATGRCERFTYGGCGGNDNNFETAEQCNRKCNVSNSPCDLILCPNGFRCELFDGEPAAFCQPDCSLNNGGCEECEECSLQDVLCKRPPCPKRRICTDLCTLPAVPGPCEAAIRRFFHNNKTGRCERFIFGGCLGNTNNFETLEDCQRKCTDPCRTKECPVGSRCEIFEPTGEAFCNPSCSLDNGGCSSCQSCSLQQVQCVRAPCPPVVQCTDICSLPAETGPCRAAIPRYFHNERTKRCERFTYGGCAGNQNNFNTIQECKRKCNVSMSSPCAGVSCPTGFRCKVSSYNNSDEPFCEPDCGLNNGGCFANQTCSVLAVACLRPPCPPPTRVCDNACPPKCSKEFCLRHPRKTCSNPGPREIPGCTGPCQFSFCKACYVSDEPIFPPPGEDCPTCSNLADYTSKTRCYKKWVKCNRRAHKKRFGRPDLTAEGQFRCYNPPCPLRG